MVSSESVIILALLVYTLCSLILLNSKSKKIKYLKRRLKKRHAIKVGGQ